MARRILVTGGAGFIGSNFLNMMVPKHKRDRFLNVDALTYAGDRGKLKVESEKNYGFVKADIRDRGAVKKVFAKFKPTHVVHFAAESHVDNSIETPHIFAETNVLGTLNLLNLARESGLKRFLHVSTDEVYGSLPKNAPPATEENKIRPSSPYSASKAASDGFVEAYHTTYGLDTVITRCSNNYGECQHIEKFIPLFISTFAKGGAAPLYGKGENIRDWIHVSDHCAGIEAALTKGKAGEVYNFGGSNEWKNKDIAKLLLKLVGNKEASIQLVTDRLGHDMRYALDSTKANRELGWKSNVKFEDGLKDYVVSFLRTLDKRQRVLSDHSAVYK